MNITDEEVLTLYRAPRARHGFPDAVKNVSILGCVGARRGRRELRPWPHTDFNDGAPFVSRSSDDDVKMKSDPDEDVPTQPGMVRYYLDTFAGWHLVVVYHDRVDVHLVVADEAAQRFTEVSAPLGVLNLGSSCVILPLTAFMCNIPGPQSRRLWWRLDVTNFDSDDVAAFIWDQVREVGGTGSTKGE